MEIYLIRHTTPQIEKGICYGQSDIPLASTFEEEKDTVLRHLPNELDAIYSSPLNRCHQLARFIHPGKSIIADERLLEMNFGDWEMKKWDELQQDTLNTWMSDFVNVCVPNGENFIALNERVQHFIKELIQQDHKKVAIVTHAGVIRCFIAHVLELSLTTTFKVQLAYSSVTKIHLQGEGCMNSIEYLNR